eukprot:Nk52_evm11s1837 gene=Nk52_evmTU11s1837
MDPSDNYSHHHRNISPRKGEEEEEEEDGGKEKQKRWLKERQLEECEEDGISQFLSQWLKKNRHLRYLRGEDKRLISLRTGLSEREAEEWFVEMKYAYGEDREEEEEDWKGRPIRVGHGGRYFEEERDYYHGGYGKEGMEGDYYRGYFGYDEGGARPGPGHLNSLSWDGRRGERGYYVEEEEGDGYGGHHYYTNRHGEDRRGMMDRPAMSFYYENDSPPFPAPPASAYHYSPGLQQRGNVVGEQERFIGGSYGRYDDRGIDSSGSQGDWQPCSHRWVGYTKEYDDSHRNNVEWSRVKDREEGEVEEEKHWHWNCEEEERELPMGEVRDSPNSPLHSGQVTGKRGLDTARDHGLGEYASQPKRVRVSSEKEIPSLDDEFSREQRGAPGKTLTSDIADFRERGDSVQEKRVQQGLLNGLKEDEGGEDGDHLEEDINGSKGQQEKASTDTVDGSKKKQISGKLDVDGSKKVTAEQAEILKEWLYSHVENPFLTEEERVRLCYQTNLPRYKIRQWFVNARLRKLEKYTKEDGTTSYRLKEKRARTKHDKETTSTLRKWLFNHKNNPFPNEEDKVALCAETGISRSDLDIWFWNNRCHLLMKRASVDGEIEYVEKPPAKGKRGRKVGFRPGQGILNPDENTKGKKVEPATSQNSAAVSTLGRKSAEHKKCPQPKKKGNELKKVENKRSESPPATDAGETEIENCPISEKAKAILNSWIVERLENPYPTMAEKEELCKDTGESWAKLKHWFVNSRSRILAKCEYRKVKAKDALRKKEPRNLLDKERTELLQNWLKEHLQYPFPSESEKVELCKQTHLTKRQLNHWLINSRRMFLEKSVLGDGKPLYMWNKNVGKEDRE